MRMIRISSLPAVLLCLVLMGCDKKDATTTTSNTSEPSASKKTAASVSAAAPAKVVPSSAPTEVASAAPPVECSYKNRDRCQGKCDGGDAKACLLWGLNLGMSEDAATQEKAIEALKKACAAKLPRACIHVAFKQRALDLHATKKQPDEEEKAAFTAVMAKACDEKDGFACDKYGKLLAEGYGVPKNEAKGSALREKAWKMMEADCEAGDPETCLVLGITYFSGDAKRSIVADAAKARPFFVKACDGGEATACKELK